MMQNINKYIIEKLKKISLKNTTKYNYFPKTTNELKALIEQLINERGEEANLNDIDVSNITNMDKLFWTSNFDGDISNWDVSNVTNMHFMFYKSKFTGKNGDISRWDVSNAENMEYMFAYSSFNEDISKWDISNVWRMRYMFAYSNFNKDISNWNVSNEVDTFNMFFGSPLKNTPKWYKYK